MDIRFLALANTLTVPVAQAKSGPWDWEKAYEMPNLGFFSAMAVVASWLASKSVRPTVPALRAAHA